MTKRERSPRSQCFMLNSRCHVRFSFPTALPEVSNRSLLVSVNGRASNINIPVSCEEHSCEVDWFSLFFIRLQDTTEGQKAGENVGLIREAALFLVPELLAENELLVDGIAIVLTKLT